MEGMSCKKSNMSCTDSAAGTLAWYNEKERTCSTTFGILYSGKAMVYDSTDKGSQIVVISNEDSGSHAGN